MSEPCDLGPEHPGRIARRSQRDGATTVWALDPRIGETLRQHGALRSVPPITPAKAFVPDAMLVVSVAAVELPFTTRLVPAPLVSSAATC